MNEADETTFKVVERWPTYGPSCVTTGLSITRNYRILRIPFLAVVFVSSFAHPGLSQDRTPRGAVSAEVGGAAVSIDYGRPALGDRMLVDLLNMLPPDRVWRAGENQVTTLENSEPVEIGGKTVPAGRYSLYLHVPESGDWTLLVNRHQGIALGKLWSEAPEATRGEPWPMLSGYSQIEEQEQARIALEKVEASGDGSVFEITAGGGVLRFAWGGVAYQATLRSP